MLPAPLSLSLRHFLAESEAVSAIEFALILPLATTLLLGSMDLGHGLVAARKVVSATSTMADQVARYSFMNQTRLSESLKSAELVLQPYKMDQFNYQLFSGRFDDDGDGDFDKSWERKTTMSATVDFEDDLEDLGSPGQGIIGLKVEYKYEPQWSYFAVGPVILEHKAVARARIGQYIDWR